MARLNRKLEESRAELRYEEPGGYLRSVLGALDVPVESQIVAFSKTSVQAQRINPQNPRTLFFNDEVTVGWVRGGFLELAAQDPRLGMVFYTLSQSQEAAKPSFVRQNECITCHISHASLGVPGMLMRSVFPRTDGLPLRPLGDFVSDHRSPFEERWGGWYVTGAGGKIRHMGNAFVTDPEKPEAMVTEETLHTADLRARFPTDQFLSPYSDIVALMVFQHQVRAMNLITRLGWEARFSEYEKEPREKSTQRIQAAANELADYLLFVGEPALPGKILGSSGFMEKFPSQRVRDRRGRSLRDFDLERRMFKYPCSYMIYTEAFDNLPIAAKSATLRRMGQILSGKDRGPKYAGLSRQDRTAIVEILRDTKKDTAAYFAAGAGQ